jgi:DNA-binding PucR family transcriptional regulator
MSLTAAGPSTDTVGSTPRLLARLLRLLAEEAPTDELEAFTAEVIQTSDPRDLLHRALGDGTRIRTMLDRGEHREREAQALYETARDLTSLRGTDAVLTAIVDRVRRLLGTDSTYIALVDEATGDAFMRVTSGTRTRAIESVRQRPGYGVGGYVIQAGQPLATANYLADPRLRLDPDVAAAVGGDGIVSIAGVPMKRGNVVVGALFAANRKVRTFDQAEIALLSSLAAHASVIIENARLFERVQADTDELREANAQLKAQRHALERAGAAHEQLMPLVLHRADLPELARTLARILDGTVAVLGSAGSVLAHAAGPGAPDVAAVLRGDTGPDTVLRTLPVRAGSETFGRLVFAHTGPLADADARTLERAAQTVALLMLLERQTSIVEQELRAELVEDLLADRAPDWTAFQRRARRSGAIDFDRPHTVVVLSATEVPRRRLLGASAELAGRYGGLAAEYAGQVVLLLPDIDADDAARAVPAALRSATGGSVTAGAAGPAASARSVRALHRGAARCHRLLLALGRAGSGASLQELGVLGMVLEGTSPEQVNRLLERTLGPLLRYDSEHRAALVDTLERYFAEGQNPPGAARDLGVHVNTVYQRLDRIDQVLGSSDWREPTGALEMQMVLQFHRLLGRGEDSAVQHCPADRRAHPAPTE